MLKKTLAVAALATVAVAGTAEARDQIRIVGSSTVFPFATVVAEKFGDSTPFATPVIESTGSGGGLKLFCAGVGTEHPDITNASRRIKSSELETCKKNGINDVVEVKIGYDGIVMANSKEGPKMSLTLRQLFLALAAQVPADSEGKELQANPYKRWSDIDSSLPNAEIEVLGPPPTSGTRDAFNELGLESGCKTFPALKALKKEDKSKYKGICRGMREDGAYIEAGENDVLIVNKLVANENAFGVFGFSFLEESADKVQGSVIGGVEPEFDTILSGEYPLARSLYFYVKKAHVGTIPGIEQYVAEFVSDKATGMDGYLIEKGLIPLPEDMRATIASNAANMKPLSLEDLK